MNTIPHTYTHIFLKSLFYSVYSAPYLLFYLSVEQQLSSNAADRSAKEVLNIKFEISIIQIFSAIYRRRADICSVKTIDQVCKNMKELWIWIWIWS